MLKNGGGKDRKGGFSMKKGKILIVGLIALLMAFGLILASCGEDPAPAPAPAPSTPTPAGSTCPEEGTCYSSQMNTSGVWTYLQCGKSTCNMKDGPNRSCKC